MLTQDLCGQSYDGDTAYVADYGQWRPGWTPTPTPTPPPAPTNGPDVKIVDFHCTTDAHGDAYVTFDLPAGTTRCVNGSVLVKKVSVSPR